jgi:hypothetical protein
MTHRHQHQMNQALDHLLDESQQIVLEQHLETTPDDADLFARLTKAEHILTSAPIITAPNGFADRVCAALASGRKPTHDPNAGLGIALGLLLTALFSIPLLAASILSVIWTLSDNGTLNLLIDWTNHTLTSLRASIGQVSGVNDPLFHESSPLALTLAVMIVPLAIFYMWTIRHLTAPNHPVTYRIPVQALG